MRKKKSKRPQKITRSNDDMMKRIVGRFPSYSCLKIKACSGPADATVSVKTISWRHCNQFDLKADKPARKSHLTSKMNMKRLAVAKI